MNAYVTQIGPDGSGHERCGAAVVASILLSAGWQSDPYGLCLEVAGRLWGAGAPRGATSDDLIAVLQGYGFQAQTWQQWPEALDALTAGKSVACLLDNWYVRPRPYPPGANWNAEHWLRLVATVDDEEMAYVYDPLTYLYVPAETPYQGPTVCTVDSLRKGIAATPNAEAGILAWRD